MYAFGTMPIRWVGSLCTAHIHCMGTAQSHRAHTAYAPRSHCICAALQVTPNGTLQGEELHAIDVNGRVYCGCGASFCMQLERKAIRETGRPVKQIVEGFRY